MANIELIQGADTGAATPDKLSQAYPKYNRSITNVNNQLANHETRVGTAEADISTLKTRMSTAENDIQTVDNRVSNIVAEAGDSNPEIADGRMNGLTGKIHPALKDRLDSESKIVGLNPNEYSGANNEAKVTSAATDAALEKAPVAIPGDFGDVEYDANGLGSDVLDLRMKPFRNLDYINALQMNLAALRYMDELRIVVTGDSLSYNRYDYDPTARSTSEAGKGGYKSWSYLIRDAFLINMPGWVHGVDCLPSSKSSAYLIASESQLSEYYAPINGRHMIYQFSAVGTKAILFVPPTVRAMDAGRSSDDLYMYFLDGYDRGGTFNVKVFKRDGTQVGTTVSFANTPDSSYYLGLGMRSVKICSAAPSDVYKIEIEMTSITLGSSPYLDIVGFAASNLVWKNTGMGSQPSQWVKDNVASLITNHNPDITFIIIGANDPALNYTESQTYQNMKDTLASIRANTNSEVILISMPVTSSYSNGRAQSRVRALRKVANEFECGFVDLYNVFRRMNTSEWRYDNVHFKRLGNQIVFETLAKLFFPTLPIEEVNQYNHHSYGWQGSGEQRIRTAFSKWRQYVRPVQHIAYDSATSTFKLQNSLSNWFAAQGVFDGSGNSWQPLADTDFLVTNDGGSNYRLRIPLPFSPTWMSPRYEPANPQNFGSAAGVFQLRINTYGSDYISYYIYKYKDVQKTDSANNTVTVKEWVPVSSLSEIDNGTAFILNLLW